MIPTSVFKPACSPGLSGAVSIQQPLTQSCQGTESAVGVAFQHPGDGFSIAGEPRAELSTLISGPILYSLANEPAVLIDDQGRLRQPCQRVGIIDIERRKIPGIPSRPSLYEVEITTGPNYAVIRLPQEAKLDQCDDVGGVLVATANNAASGFALGDGVGSSIGPRTVAIAVIKEALYRMGSLHTVDEATMKTYAQEIDISLRSRYDAARFLQSIEELDVGNDPLKNNLRRDAMQRLRRKPIYTGATTLIAGCIRDHQLGVIRIGDGGFFVIGHDGRIKTLDGHFFRGDTPAQIRANREFPLADHHINYGEATLHPGDLIVAYSDGLLKGIYTETCMLAERTQSLFLQGADEEAIATTLLQESCYVPPAQGWADDNVVICLRHV